MVARVESLPRRYYSAGFRGSRPIRRAAIFSPYAADAAPPHPRRPSMRALVQAWARHAKTALAMRLIEKETIPKDRRAR